MVEEPTSILESIKKMLGILPDYNVFDYDISVHIRNAFHVLYQLGIQVKDDYDVAEVTWEDVFSDYSDFLSYIKDYIYLKVRVIFDPPNNTSVTSSYEAQISEMEWRMRMKVENRFDDEEIDDSNNGNGGDGDTSYDERISSLEEYISKLNSSNSYGGIKSNSVVYKK